MKHTWTLAVVLALAGALAAPASAADPDKDAPVAKPTGQWQVLFDGKNLDQWDYNPKAWEIQDGTLYTPGKGGDIYSKEKFQDFVLDMEFKVAKGCNSGVFIRMASRKDWLNTSIEIQVLDSSANKKPGKHDCGAIYDCKAPDAQAEKPAGEWNRFQIAAVKSRLWVALNGVPIQTVDLADWKEAKKNPDGSPNKFRDPVSTIVTPGFFAMQTHGAPVWYRNVKVLVLDPAKALAKCPKCETQAPEGMPCPKCKKAEAPAAAPAAPAK